MYCNLCFNCYHNIIIQHLCTEKKNNMILTLSFHLYRFQLQSNLLHIVCFVALVYRFTVIWKGKLVNSFLYFIRVSSKLLINHRNRSLSNTCFMIDKLLKNIFTMYEQSKEFYSFCINKRYRI